MSQLKVMMNNILQKFAFLFVGKASRGDIEKILQKENFIFTYNDVEDLFSGNEKGVRYGGKVLDRIEQGRSVRRFIKIVLDGSWETHHLFKRQVFVTEVMEKKIQKKSKCVNVIVASTVSRPAYAIFETLPIGENFGFMHDSPEFYKGLSQEQVNSLVKEIFYFHHLGSEMNKEDQKIMQKIRCDDKFYIKELKKNLDKKIKHKDVNGNIRNTTPAEIFGKECAIENFRAHAIGRFKKNLKEMQRSGEGFCYLVHADMAIDNIYKSPEDDFILLDFEWVGVVSNAFFAIMYDYGNLRTRAWSSEGFQNKLDNSFLKIGESFGFSKKEIKNAMQLGLMRSTLLLGAFHLDYYYTTRNDRRSDRQYYNMYTKTIKQWRDLEKNT